MEKVRNQEEADNFVAGTLPPGEVLPEEYKGYIDSDPPYRDIPTLFFDAMAVAFLRVRKYGNTLLLEALRKKWPEAAAKYEASKASAA